LIVDGRSVSAGSKLAADICIIGAGAAGITLAHGLTDSKLSVLLLESGGFEPEASSQDFARGESVGQRYIPLESARLRCFGGSTMHWGGWCRPLEPVDFEQRAWVPYSGWPITRATLEPYYPLAQEFCQLGEFAYDPADWDLPNGALLSLPADRWHSRIIQFSPPTRFGIRYRDQIARATTLTVYLHSTALRLTASGNGRRILGLKVATLAGNSFEVTAKSYVLAAGGIDNPRLLLASNDVLPAGIGNDHDLVGRFFADHIQLDTAGLFPVDRRMNLDLYQPSSREIARHSRHAGARSANLMAYLTLDRQVQQSRHVLNYSANVLATSWSDYFITQKSTGGVAEQSYWQEFVGSLRRLWGNLDAAVEQTPASDAPIFKIVTTQEQAPNPASRVRLASERDALGMPRPALDWRLSELDRQTIEVAVDELAKAFGAAGSARIHAPLELQTRGWPQHIPISWHHCCTTRMSDDPKNGVVDANGRVHGVDNLYVAGSSVFSTSGNGNPTLSIVALALRLADRLKEVLR